ncbi:hypothetical protein H0H93_006293 [Arthromyces matolae]|nr:hypothetical protein H0H93_006293 [Arthromyces matolae]
MVSTRRQSGSGHNADLAVVGVASSVLDDMKRSLFDLSDQEEQIWEDDEEETEEDDEESDWENEKGKGKAKGKSSKRAQPAPNRAKIQRTSLVNCTKSSSQSAESTEKVTKIGRSRKDISLLPIMPLDIVFSDLVSLTRTSKSLRDTLSAPNALGVWKAVRVNAQVPDPPLDFSEQRWAILLFGGSLCQCCGTSGIHNIEFNLRRRLCTTCKKEKWVHLIPELATQHSENQRSYVVESRFSSKFPGQNKAILDLILYTDRGAWSHGHASKSRFFWNEDIEDMIQQYGALTSLRSAEAKRQVEEFRNQRHDFVETALKEAKNFARWSYRSTRKHQFELFEKRKARRSAIQQRFHDLGYDTRDTQYLECDPSVNELTDRGWARIRPSLEKKVIAAQNSRLEGERMGRTLERIKLLWPLFDDHMRGLPPSLWPQYPDLQDVAAFPEFKEIIASPERVTEATFAPALAHLPSLVTRWLEDKKLALKTQFDQDVTEHSPGLTESNQDLDVLTLATSVFQCNSHMCKNVAISLFPVFNPLFGWTDVSRHKCRSVQNPLAHLSHNKTEFMPNKVASALVAQLVRLASLDPTRTTVEDMDREGRLFACSKCHSGGAKQFFYPWRAAISHWPMHSRDPDPASWRLLSQEEAANVEIPNMTQASFCAKLDLPFMTNNVSNESAGPAVSED